jgi:hypothetical protein
VDRGQLHRTRHRAIPEQGAELRQVVVTSCFAFVSKPSLGNAVGVAVDAIAAAVPFVPGGVWIARPATNAAGDAVKGAGKVADAAKADIPKPPTGKGSVPPDQRDPKRVWSKDENAKKLDEQGGKCANCGQKTTIDDAKGHHIDRHADGGKTDSTNQAVVCTDCHKDLHSAK